MNDKIKLTMSENDKEIIANMEIEEEYYPEFPNGVEMTAGLLEDTLTVRVKKNTYSFAIDKGHTETNFKFDPYFKFFIGERSKSKVEYRVFMKRAAYTIHRNSDGKKSPEEFSFKDIDKMLDGLNAPVMWKGEHYNRTFDALCAIVDYYYKTAYLNNLDIPNYHSDDMKLD